MTVRLLSGDCRDVLKTLPSDSVHCVVTSPPYWGLRANGGAKTNGPMKAVARGIDKQRGHSRRHAGFNDRWDAMGKADQCAGGRNLRNVWTIATRPFSEAHFATFPPKLAETCILAGTSERGCCPSCGAPWVRQINVEYENPGNRNTNGPRSLERRHETAGFDVRLERRASTTGWRPTCVCLSADPIPCVVLDPFGGAGTTGLVADRLQRDAILIELNLEYAGIARSRVYKDAGLFAEVVS